jgi:DNA-binding response OmpR family regulator
VKSGVAYKRSRLATGSGIGSRFGGEGSAMASSDTALKRILIVEDEWLIAATLVDMVYSFGHEVVGPAPNTDRAFQLIVDELVDAALLDVSLGAENSFSIAAVLKRLDIPFVFVTGNTSVDLPTELRGELLVSKPVTDADLRACLTHVLSANT